jgi:hypothetical protein
VTSAASAASATARSTRIRPRRRRASCIPTKSKSAWSQCSGANGACQRFGCLPSFGYCGIEDVCTAACDKCLINGACFKKDFANPDNVCLKCVPATNQTAFADTCPKCTPECKNGGICTGTTTRRCNCEGTNMVGAACDRAPVCAKPCQNNAPCVVTNYATGAAACSCEGTGFKGDDCSVCDPDVQSCVVAPKLCNPACRNGGACKDGVCDCAGTGFEGAQCQTKSPLQCLPACENGGRCDTATGRCDCAPAPLFEGAQCQTRKATPAPPGEMMVPTPPVDKDALCKARCDMTCASTGVLSCACSDTNELSVVCKSTNKEKCTQACAAACPGGTEECICDETTGVPSKMDCILTPKCQAQCDAACPSKQADSCKCDELSGKMVFTCTQKDPVAPIVGSAASRGVWAAAIAVAAMAAM